VGRKVEKVEFYFSWIFSFQKRKQGEMLPLEKK